MTTLTQGIEPLEFLLSEANGKLSRDQATVTLAANTPLQSGQVLGKITASGKYVAHNTGASDGSQNAAAVLGTELSSTSAGDYKALIFTRQCEVIGNRLNGGTPPLAAAITQLAALGIIVR